VDEDTSGLTFEEWDRSEDTDASQAPVAMIVNSSEMCWVPGGIHSPWIKIQKPWKNRCKIAKIHFLWKIIIKNLFVWCDDPPAGSGDLHVCRIFC
jgi:hypothetical protein